MRKRTLAALLLLIVGYFGSYIRFRNTHIEAWQRDRRLYVILRLNRTWLWYLYRPLTRSDSLPTGMRFHPGPHR